MLRFVIVLLLTVVLAGCGPLFGQISALSDGVKEVRVLKGELAGLPAGAALLVYGPFDKTAEAFYLCRGEDAADFAAALEEAGLFSAALYLERDFDRRAKTAAELRRTSGPELQRQLDLDQIPEMILFGTILERRTSVAPTRGSRWKWPTAWSSLI